MSINALEGKEDTGRSRNERFSDVLCLCSCALFLSLPVSLIAQVPEQTGLQISESGQDLPEQNEALEEPVEVTVTLPDSLQMAMALATPGLREQALLDLAVAANTLSRAQARAEVEVDVATLAQSSVDDRAWLQTLVDHYGWRPPRDSVLDPAAWLVLQELQQQDLEDTAVVFPGRIPRAVLIHQVFQRASEPLAVANLPGLLYEVEADAINLWDAFLQLTGTQESRDSAWKVVETAWFTDRQLPLSTDVEEDLQSPEEVIENIPQAMSNLVLSAIDARPPDSRGLRLLRYSILKNMHALTGEENIRVREQARDSLYLVNLVDGLHDGRYFDFIQGMLSITSGLLDLPQNAEATFSLVDWLVLELPAISAHYAVNFADEDPRLNAAMAAAYEVLLTIASFDETDSVDSDSAVEETVDNTSVNSEPVDNDLQDDHLTGLGPGNHNPGTHNIEIKASRKVLANAVAQLALLIPDMGYYFDTPVRARIAEEINICISIAASSDETGGANMTRRQFDACMETLLQLADQETRLAELSGNMNGPFTIDTLRRELNITPWQRINYGIGYLHDRYATTCQSPARPLPNPLEWAVLATTMTWFAANSPEFTVTPENETRLTRMRGIGEQLIIDLAEQSGCLAATGAGINDPVSRSMTDYELALRDLDEGMKKAEVDFRTERLSPGADVSLDQDASQKTSYRPDNLVIEPCDRQAVCEMSGNLSTTRALIGLFPDEYLVAEQTGKGHIEICYRNMEWVRRRSELVRADDENVSNYFGHLGFDLVGRYVENDRVSEIFGFRFTSPDEQRYLFAQTSDEVLDDSCPVEWVGSRVVTPLRENRRGIVPNRLTYLAAARSLPSRLLQNNWDRGAEWRDWFVTGIGVSPLDMPPVPEITIALNQHLQSLYQAAQAGIYQRVLLPEARNSQGNDVSLFEEMSQVTIAKTLIRMQLMMFYPESMSNSDAIRTAIAGDAGLVEGRSFRRFREDSVALTSVNRIAMERLNKLRETWSKQPEALRRQGSVSTSVMNALTRINNLYRQFYTSRPEPLQEIVVTEQPQAQSN